MKARHKQIFTIAVCIVFLLAGCGENQSGYSGDAGTGSTVQNIFTEPSESTETGTTPGQSEATNPEPTNSSYEGVSYGPEKYAMDDSGAYLLYEGGEMHMEFGITATGSMATQGTGILLFIDGQLQPYKTAGDDTYRYMHVFHPQDGQRLVEELIFSPVTGTEGDDLELWYAGIFWPDYSYSADGAQGMVLSSGMPASGLRLKYAASPSDVDLMDTTDRVISWSCNQVEVTKLEIDGWTQTDFQEKYEYHMYVNDSEAQYIMGIHEETPVRVRFEIWGNPYVHYGLVLFVDNQPVSLSADDIMLFGVSSGQKTVVEVELDMGGFDGESVIYAALIPRNWRSAEVLTYNWLDTTNPVFLYETSPFPEE